MPGVNYVFGLARNKRLEALLAPPSKGTVLAKATAGTIRLRLFKVAAMVVVSVRRVHVRMASAFPLQELFRQAGARLGSG